MRGISEADDRAHNPEVAGSSPAPAILCNVHNYADVAQLAEQMFCNHQVAGSIPVVSSDFCEERSKIDGKNRQIRE